MITIQKDSNFALVGHGFHLCYFYENYLKLIKKKPIILTHKKKYHLSDIRSFKGNKSAYQNIFKLKNAQILQLDNINKASTLRLLKKNKIEYIFSFSSRFIFKKNFLKIYKNRVFNIHPSILPEERGAGTFTNRILNKKFFVAATIHYIDNGIDTGNILFQTKKQKVKRNLLPLDYIIKTNKCYKYLIDKFLLHILKKKKISIKKQKNSSKTYFARYNANLNGTIDWTIKGNYIEDFIRGFSKPYAGANTKIFVGKKIEKVSILNAIFKKNNLLNHPYMFGKIFYQDKEKIKIIVNGGFLLVKLVDLRLKKKISKFEGKTFFNYDYDIILSKKIININ
jgi:methionyl-tRNA formyltransferase